MVSAALYRQRSRTVAHARDLAASLTMHRRIAKAIATRDPDRARDAMHEHLLRAQRARKLEKPAPNRAKRTPRQ
jgi:DNA-binding FadR family transcriptional regulator